MHEENILEMREISMHFPGVIALDHAQLSLRRGEVLGLIGENGAGKSTMMNILLGSLKPTEGTMVLKGRPYAVSYTHLISICPIVFPSHAFGTVISKIA